MAFWSQATLEPLRQYRWVVTFGSSLDVHTYALKKVTKPKAKVNTVQHKYMNHFFNYPGRLEWEDISMTFAAVPEGHESGLGTSRTLVTILAQAGYVIPSKNNSATDYATISKNLLKQGIGDLVIKNLDPEGNTTESFKIVNPIFTSINFGSLDYGSEEIVEVECGVKYDYALFVDQTGTALTGTPDLSK